MSPRRPGRLRGFDYRGCHRYFLTLCTRGRTRAFDNGSVVSMVLTQFRETAASEHFALFAYCFMPDHLHVLAEGLRPESDLRRFAASAKQRSGFQYAQRQGTPLWQESYHDRVLRREETTLVVARYILANPVRAGLAGELGEYPYAGSDVYALGQLIDAVSDVRDRQG